MYALQGFFLLATTLFIVVRAAPSSLITQQQQQQQQHPACHTSSNPTHHPWSMTPRASSTSGRFHTCIMRGGQSNYTKTTTENDKQSISNSAFVFIKPHANTEAVQALVKSKLLSRGISILTEFEITGEEIDQKKLIDQHYYAIASKATILNPRDIAVPESKFEESFGENWIKVLSENRAANAMQACERFECTPDELDEAWARSKVVKFGGGFYCGLVEFPDKQPLYVFNAFFMSMRSRFVGKNKSIHCYEVQWSPQNLSWADFRGKLLGPTNPADAPKGSIRRDILKTYKKLGLESIPNKSDNGVHASASPFEGLVERMNWMNRKLTKDDFGKQLLQKRISKKKLNEWSTDPRVKLPCGETGSLFDYVEDLDASRCADALQELASLK